MRKSLLWKIAPWYVGVAFLSIFVVSWYAIRTARDLYLQQTQSGLEEKAHLLEHHLAQFLYPVDAVMIQEVCVKLGQRGTRVTVMLPSGRVVGDSHESPSMMDDHRDRPEFIQALQGKTGMAIRYSNTLQKKMMYVAIPLKGREDVIGSLRTSLPLVAIDEALRETRTLGKIALVASVAAMLLALSGLAVLRPFTRTIDEMISATDRFARGRFSERISIPQIGEFARLASSLNGMATQLGEKMKTIQKQGAERDAMLDSMVEGVIAIDKEERIINTKSSSCSSVGYEDRDCAESHGS